jgi:hypothetical protein
MRCKICHINEAETTDCRCQFCISKPQNFIYKNWLETDNRTEFEKYQDEISPESEKAFYKQVFSTKT